MQSYRTPHAPTNRYRHKTSPARTTPRAPEAPGMGRQVVVAVTEGRLDFGPWERIFYGEFDGRRRKRVLVKIIGE